MSNKINIISCQDAFKNEPKYLNVKGVILSEGSYAEQSLFDKFTPGHSCCIYDTIFKSPFKSFNKDTSGIMCSIGDTNICVITGQVNDMKVLFIHPTSPSVNYDDISSYFKKHFPDLFFIDVDCDGNFIDKIINLKN
jgi:hypothetical protein